MVGLDITCYVPLKKTKGEKMELHKFLSLLAVCFGLVGSVFLAKGIIFIRHKTMLHLTSPYSRYDYAPEQIDSLAAQKAWASVGIKIIILAFSIQLVALIFVEHGTLFVKSRLIGACIVFATTAILTAIFIFVAMRLHSFIRVAIGKIAVRDYCAEHFTTGKIGSANNVKCLETMSQDLLNVNKKARETKIDFIKRVAKCVGWTIPEGTDFSKIVDNDNGA